MQKEVEAAIGGFLKSGEKSFIKYKVNSDIIGGMIVSIGDKYADMSMASKLKKYEDIIKSAA
jgi:F-type H+-transporting ATPase subunit O